MFANGGYLVTPYFISRIDDRDGNPVSLLSGTAREAGAGQGREVQLFTNKAGRFGAQGLSPGRWLIEMDTDPQPTRFVLEIPPGTKGAYNAGALHAQVGETFLARAD